MRYFPTPSRGDTSKIIATHYSTITLPRASRWWWLQGAGLGEVVTPWPFMHGPYFACTCWDKGQLIIRKEGQCGGGPLPYPYSGDN